MGVLQGSSLNQCAAEPTNVCCYMRWPPRQSQSNWVLAPQLRPFETRVASKTIGTWGIQGQQDRDNETGTRRKTTSARVRRRKHQADLKHEHHQAERARRRGHQTERAETGVEGNFNLKFGGKFKFKFTVATYQLNPFRNGLSYFCDNFTNTMSWRTSKVPLCCWSQGLPDGT